MTFLRTLKKLVLGETWLLPLGVAAVLVAGGLLTRLHMWPGAGGFALLGGVVVVLVASVTRGATRR
jgi:hypothetical protein